MVKGSSYLEALSKTRRWCLTRRAPSPKECLRSTLSTTAPWRRKNCWNMPPWRKALSSHPISKSIQRAYGREPDRSRVTDIEEIGGNGVTAVVDGICVAAGNDKLMERLGIDYKPCHHVGPLSIWRWTGLTPGISSSPTG